MVKPSDVVVIPPRGGALTRSKPRPAAAGLALINRVLAPDVVRAMVAADEFRYAMLHPANDTYLGIEPIERCERLVDRAARLLRSRLQDISREVMAKDVLLGILYSPPGMLSAANASAMLHYLFGAMGRRRNDEAAAKLLACADIFSPHSNSLGSALGLWKPAPAHPVILALAIKGLMAEKVHEPAESELREALGRVQQRLHVHSEQWLELLDRADQIVFMFDRPTWDAAYAEVPSAVSLTMQGQLFLEDPGEDDDGNAIPPSPRWQALADVIEAKRAIKQVAKPKRVAACEARQAKRRREAR